MMASNEYFRAGVGVVVVDHGGLVLALERSGVPDGWQLPQGGIETGEEAIDAARRELEQETGIAWSSVELLDEYPTWLGYELPAGHRSRKTGRGQVHRWYLVRFVGEDTAIDLEVDAGGVEFSRWRWMSIGDLVEVTWEIRRPTYRALASRWSTLLL